MPGENKGENRCGITEKKRSTSGLHMRVGEIQIKECSGVLGVKSKTAVDRAEIIVHLLSAMQQQPIELGDHQLRV
jgi:hypothetical protein